MDSSKLSSIEATLTFADGETCQVILAHDNDQAWGNIQGVLSRSVNIREVIANALFEAEMFEEQE
ncbi:MAG: hypothetical protein ACTH7X_08735 [Brevibacterium aurantiacum]